MPIVIHSEYVLGDMLITYLKDRDDPVSTLGLQMIPFDRLCDRTDTRGNLSDPYILALPANWRPIQARGLDPLVHTHIRGDVRPSSFRLGRTLRGGPSTNSLRRVSHAKEQRGLATVITTTLRSPHGMVFVHELSHSTGEAGIRIMTRVINHGPVAQTLELLTSFSLGGITPFHHDDAAGQLFAHRFRSAWSAEGRHLCESIESLHLERSWLSNVPAAERFGQVGSMPTNGWFPCLAIEDRGAKVFWGAQLACPGSWQLELYRNDDQLAVSGGLADRELGHWWKTLQPREEMEGPQAYVTCTSGTLDDVCDRLVSLQQPIANSHSVEEEKMSVIFNEWCRSWGRPGHDNILALADRLRECGVRYLVIDDGWARRSDTAPSQENGDWIVNTEAFPSGMRATCDELRKRGIIPGIWFEYEIVNEGSNAFAQTPHLLHLDGLPLMVGKRRFWDFRDPWVHDYLAEKVIKMLRANGFGYLKIDYNDTIGIGCDGSESAGEGLRLHLVGVQKFLARIRRELPDLVIENCASGGHRLEPSFMSMTALTSISDAHETPAIPIIAANLHRLMHPGQSQIWAVVHSADSEDRLHYSLAATFLGRMCLSGEIDLLKPEQIHILSRGIALYKRVSSIIANGRPRRYGKFDESWQHPSGSQWVITLYRKSILLVWHAFAKAEARIVARLPSGKWELERSFCPNGIDTAVISNKCELVLDGVRPWSGGVIVLSASQQPNQPPRRSST